MKQILSSFFIITVILFWIINTEVTYGCSKIVTDVVITDNCECGGANYGVCNGSYQFIRHYDCSGTCKKPKSCKETGSYKGTIGFCYCCTGSCEQSQHGDDCSHTNPQSIKGSIPNCGCI